MNILLFFVESVVLRFDVCISRWMHGFGGWISRFGERICGILGVWLILDGTARLPIAGRNQCPM